MKTFNELTQRLDEILTKSTPAGEWIHDFVHSDDPKFKGKSAAKRKQMALAAYYAKKNESAAVSQNSTAEVDMREAAEHHLVHVSDGSKYDEEPHKDDVAHVMAGAKKHGGEVDGHSDKGVFFKFKSHQDAENFSHHVNKCPKRSCHADLTEAVEYKGIGTDVVDKKKKLNPTPPLTMKPRQVKDFKEEVELISKHEVRADAPHKDGGHVILSKGSNKWHILHHKKTNPTAKDLHSSKLLHSYDDEKEARAKFKSLKEEAEQIDELSKDTVKSYKDKVQRDVGRAYAIHKDPWKKTDKDDMHKLRNRVKGDERADMRLKEDQEEDDRRAAEHHQQELERQEQEAKKKEKVKEEVKKPTGNLKKACWKGYTAVGLKMKDGRKVPNCVPEEVQLDEAGKVYDPITKKMVARKPIKVQAGGGATRNGVPVTEPEPSKYKTIRQAYDAATAGQKVTPKQVKEAYEHGPIDRDAKLAVGHKAAVLAGSGLDSGKHGTIVGSSKERTGDHWHIKTASGEIVKMHKHRVAKLKENVTFTEKVLNEVSKSTLMRYVPSAARDVGSHTYKGKESGEWASHYTKAGDWSAAERHSKDAKKSFDKANKRIKGIDLATKKLGTQKEEVQNEAIAHPLPVQHAVSAVHKTLGPDSASRFLSHLKPGTEKHTTWDKVNDALVKQGVHTRHIARIAQHTSHMNEELDEAHEHNGVPGTQVKPKISQVKTQSKVLKKEEVEESRGHKVLATFFKNREVAQRAFTGQNKPAETPKEPEKKELKKEGVNPALMAILKKRQAAQSATKPIDIGIETPKKDTDQKKKMMGIREGFMTPSIEADMKNLSAYEYLKKYGKHKHQHRKSLQTRSADIERVAEGFDDYHAIAKELVKRHGKNVDTGHIQDIEGERDSHRPLDRSEVMHHVNKILAAKKDLKEAEMPTDEKWTDYMGKSLTHAHELHKQHAAAHPAEKADIKGKISKHNQRIIDAAKKLRREEY